MAITLTTTPTYSLAGAVRVTATATGGGNLCRLWCTDAPDGSEYRNKLDASGATRVAINDGVGLDTGEVFVLSLGVGGRYTFQAQEYVFGASTHGGGYRHSPDSWPSEAKIGGEDTVTIDIGQRVECRLGASKYGTAVLLLYLFGDYVRATTVPVHGEISPAIVGVSSDRAHTAAKTAAVTSQIAALVDQTASTIIGSVQTLHSELRTELPDHCNNVGGAYHAVADTNNDTAIEELPVDPATPEGYAWAAHVLRQRLESHMTNDANDAAARYHQSGGSARPDYANALIADPTADVRDMSIVMAAYADIVNVYEAHRQLTTAHGVADVTNIITTASTPLWIVHREFLAALRPLAPTAAGDVNPALTKLAHGAGFHVANKAGLMPGVLGK